MSNEVTVAALLLIGTLVTAGLGFFATRNKPGITPPTPSPGAGPDGGWVNVGASMLELSKVVSRHSDEREEDRREMDAVKQHLTWWQTRAQQMEYWGIHASGEPPRTPPPPHAPPPPGFPPGPLGAS